jgi:hypothetical protein
MLALAVAGSFMPNFTNVKWRSVHLHLQSFLAKPPAKVIDYVLAFAILDYFYLC